MRPVRRILPLLLLVLLAGMPAVAHAQGGAGDDQYSDPFGPSTKKPADSGSSKGSGSSSGSTNSGSAGSGPSSSSSTSSGSNAGSAGGGSSSSGSATSTPAPAAEPALGTSTPEIDRTELPRTGSDAWLIALLGCGLTAVGVGLRLRLRTADDRPA